MERFESTTKFAKEWLTYKEIAASTHDVILLPEITKTIYGNDKTICDLGCGDGELTRKLFNLKPKSIIGLDINLTLLDIAKRGKSDNLNFYYCDLSKDLFPIKNNEIDVIISSNLFMHLDDVSLDHTLKECARIMNPASIACFFVTNFKWAETHYKLIKNDEFTYYTKRDIWNYNVKEFYRTEESFTKIFEKSDFRLINVKHLDIPSDIRLDIRYLSRIGEPLFTKYEVKKIVK